MRNNYVKSALVFSGIAFVIVFFSSLQQNTVITSLFRGSIGLLPGALFGIILAYIWYLTAINVMHPSGRDSENRGSEEEFRSDENKESDGQTAEDDEQTKLAADFVKTKLND